MNEQAPNPIFCQNCSRKVVPEKRFELDHFGMPVRGISLGCSQCGVLLRWNTVDMLKCPHCGQLAIDGGFIGEEPTCGDCGKLIMKGPRIEDHLREFFKVLLWSGMIFLISLAVTGSAGQSIVWTIVGVPVVIVVRAYFSRKPSP